MIRCRWGVLSLLLFSTAYSQEEATKDSVAYTFARLITISGKEFVPGTIWIKEGKIKSVGQEISIPAGVKTIDLSRYTAMPGMVDAASWIGVKGSSNEETSEITPGFRIVDCINPRDKMLQQSVQLGVTSIQIEPGNQNVIGGLGSVFKPVGKSVRGMLVREDVLLKAVMGREPVDGNFAPRGAEATFFSRRPTTRMGVVWEFQKAFQEAQNYRKERRSEVDEEKEILLRAMEKKIPVRIFARKSYDIETALRLSDEFGFTLQLEGGEEAFRYVKEIAERKIAVALMPSYATSSLSFSGEGEVRFDTFHLLTQAGIPVALLPGLSGDRESMLAMAAFTVKYGATREEVLRAITLVPAEMLGVSDRVGSLAEGKDADFIVLNGDPLDVKSRIEWVFIDGARVFGRSLSEY